MPSICLAWNSDDGVQQRNAPHAILVATACVAVGLTVGTDREPLEKKAGRTHSPLRAYPLCISACLWAAQRGSPLVNASDDMPGVGTSMPP